MMLRRRASFMCCVWGCLISSLALAEGSGVQVSSRHGLRFELPAGFVAAASATRRSSSEVRVWSDGADLPVQVFVLESAPSELAQAAQSGDFALPTYARGLAKGLQDKLGLPEPDDVVPVAHDAERGAARVFFKSVGPSQARAMQALPDTHPAWLELQRAGVDTQRIRCLVQALLAERPSAAEAELARNYPAAVSGCRVSLAQVEAFVHEVGLELFAATELSFHALTFFARTGTLNVVVTAAAARSFDAKAVADTIWSSAVLRADASARGMSRFETGQLIGVVVGSALAVLLLGGGGALLLARFARVSQGRAVFYALSSLVSLALLGIMVGRSTTPAGVQLATFVLTGLVLFQPMSRWVGARSKGAP